jgi:hypothetical protein
MQLNNISAAPTPRQEAAQALAAVPMAIAMTATMEAMGRSMSGQPASRAELLDQLLQQLPPQVAHTTMLDAIDGALALAPELADRGDSLRQAAAGVQALLVEVAADRTPANAEVSLAGIMTPLETLMGPVIEAAMLLDPTFGQE